MQTHRIHFLWGGLSDWMSTVWQKAAGSILERRTTGRPRFSSHVMRGAGGGAVGYLPHCGPTFAQFKHGRYTLRFFLTTFDFFTLIDNVDYTIGLFTFFFFCVCVIGGCLKRLNNHRVCHDQCPGVGFHSRQFGFSLRNFHVISKMVYGLNGPGIESR